MSSDPFDLLGLDRKTATDADVRRAYAEKLKVTRPDEDRKGFMALRAAFERARDDVRWRGEYGDDETYAEYDEDETEPAAGSPPEHVPEAAQETSAEAAEAGEPSEDEDEEDDHFPLTEAEQTYQNRIDAAMDALLDLLTATGAPPLVQPLMLIIDQADLGGIEEYQTMQWRVRQLLCDRTGHFLDPSELRVPDWLSLEVFDALDAYYGWTRQPVSNAYVRSLNDWLARVRRASAGDPLPGPMGALRSPASENPAKGEQDGSLIWLWVGAGILLFQVVRFFAGVGG